MMETTGKKKRKKEPSTTIEKIKRGYVEFVLENGKKPASVYKFCKELGIKEDSFYSVVGSIPAIEKAIWKEYASETIERLSADQNYLSFTTREKLLTFYFTLLEVMRPDRDFINLRIKKWKVASIHPRFLNKFRKEYEAWASQLLEEGKKSNEIATRPFFEKAYGVVLWYHLHFLLKFWVNDSSADFEKTDMAVEKSVNLAFDLMGKGVLDNAFDFGKFLIQQARD